MKKIIISLLLSCMAVATFAQSKHLSFKGIELNGDYRTFVNKLKATGTYTDVKDGDTPGFKGTFAGYKNCEIYVLATPKTKTVYRVFVMVPSDGSWSEIKGKYNTLKKNLAAKYGTPISDEYFDKTYKEGDGHELYAIREKKGSWDSYFITPQGHIELSINAYMSWGLTIGYVGIVYEDSVNRKIWDKETNSIVMEDL